MEQNYSPIVMVIDDDEVDIEAFCRAVDEREMNYKVMTRQNGRDALELLKSDEFTPEQLATLIVLLDINMPGMNGHQFLNELRETPELRRTIVFVLSTSNHNLDKAKAYDKNIAGYFVKSKLEGVLEALESYIENVEFPPADLTTGELRH
jgi:CheY-like chemotaxis protein